MSYRTMMLLLCMGVSTTVPAAFATGTGGPKGELSPALVKAKKLVDDRLEELTAKGARVAPVADEPVVKTFAADAFVAVHFPEWPVARQPPPPLKSRNVFAVGKDGKVQHLTDAKGLEKFFQANLPAVKEANAAQAAEAWLRLTQTFVQDGFYNFTVGKAMKVAQAPGGGVVVEADLLVVPERGNKGSLHATLTFDKDGKLEKAVEDNKVVRGIRPRCQATRLLDPDPVIRAICEQDILVMGVAARDYLMEQRAQAGPELRRAIDRLWQRILDEGR